MMIKNDDLFINLVMLVILTLSVTNHVHVLFKPYLSERELQETFDETGHLAFVGEHPGLSRIMQALKGRSARECNVILSRTGAFWEHESFDHAAPSGTKTRSWSRC